MRLFAAILLPVLLPCALARADAKPSPESSPEPSASVIPLVPISEGALSGIPEATIKKCLEITNRWKDFASQAQAALGECLFHRFHRACEEARKISESEKGPHAVCRQVMEKKKIKFLEMSCVFVQVPENCGKQ
jgi:hypothetical protein